MSNPLLGEQTQSAGGTYTWETELDIDSLAYLQHHSIQGVRVLPGAVYVEMALAATTAAFGRAPDILEEVAFHRILFLPDDGKYVLKLVLSTEEDGGRKFKVYSPATNSEEGADLSAHVSINIRAETARHMTSATDQLELEEIRSLCTEEKSAPEFYAELSSNGNQYGPDFRGVERLWLGDGKSLAALRVPGHIENQLGRYHLHPVLLDSASQTVLATASRREKGTYLLAGIDQVRFYSSPGASNWAYATSLPAARQDGATLAGNVWLLNESGQKVVGLLGVRFKHLTHDRQSSAAALPAVTIAITATFTAEPIEESLAFWMRKFNVPARIVFAPYNQVFQQLLDPSSLLHSNRDGLNVLMVRFEDWMRNEGGHAGELLDGDKERLLAGCARHVLANRMEVAHLNRYETEYLYEEIFTNETYVKNGIKLSDGDCVVDVGANIGLFTLFVGQRFKDVKVYAFEPAPPAFEALKINTTLYGSDVTLFNCGLSDKNEEARFTFYNRSSVFSGFHADAEQDRAALKVIVENLIHERANATAATSGLLADELMEGRLESETYLCQLRTLSSVIKEQEIRRIDLLKIDAERSEWEVLAGIEEEDWRIIKQIVVEVHDKQGGKLKQIVRLLEGKGFDVSISEEELLSGSGLFNIYARRPTEADPVAAEESLAPRADRKLEQIIKDLIGTLKTLQHRSVAPLIVCVCPPSPALMRDSWRMELFARLERHLASELYELSAAYFVGYPELMSTYTVSDYYDPHANELGHIPYSTRFFTALGTMLARKFVALRRAPFKVITLDCDQTLWGGVCGEDGPTGVKIDGPRRRLQEFMVAQHEAGMLLCICSKNNEEDAMAVFDSHPEMPLKREHILRRKLNWRPKSENIKSLARELGLGLDSFIHVDDNPVDCAEVEANCPEVLTLQLPAQPEDIPKFLEQVWAFDHLKITEEDKRRTSLYQRNIEREALRQSSLTFASFLAGLQLEVKITDASPCHLVRAAQLTQRTNQFNFTTIKRSQAELQEVVHSGMLECLVVDVSDRFGDYAIVGLILFKADFEAIAVETFLLSCRALGKGVEHRMLATLGQIAAERGLGFVKISFIHSGKNQAALEFLSGVAGRDDSPSSQPEPVEGSGQRFIFKVPADILAQITFDPDSARIADSNSGESLMGSPVGIESGVGHGVREDAPLLRLITTGLNNVDQILNLIESEKKRPKPGPPQSFEAPGNEVERVLKNIWQEVLGVDQVGVTDNFFELGGSSLEAVLVISELKKRLDIDLSTISLFDKTTISSMAGMLKSGGGEDWGEKIASSRRRGQKRRAKNLARLRRP